MDIRKAIVEDVNAITDCVKNAYKHYILCIGKPPGPMIDDYADIVSNQMVYVAEQAGEIAGVLVLMPDHVPILLDNLAVDPQFQHQGIGNALLNFAENLVIEKGHASIQLYTHELMHENIQYYKSKGYVVTHHLMEKGYQRIYMKKDLNS